jgi:hypothetical protein
MRSRTDPTRTALENRWKTSRHFRHVSDRCNVVILIRAHTIAIIAGACWKAFIMSLRWSCICCGCWQRNRIVVVMVLDASSTACHKECDQSNNEKKSDNAANNAANQGKVDLR